MIHHLDLFILFVMSLLTFALFGWDKHKAIYGKRRINEFTLLLCAFLAGAFGALCGMIFFRHKTLHTRFLIAVPIFLALQLAADILLRTIVWNGNMVYLLH